VITEAGTDPQEAGLVYLAAGAPNSGESFNDWWKDYTPAPGVAEIRPYGKDGYVAFTQLGVRQYFAQDLPKEEADAVYAVQGRSQRGASMTRSARQHGTRNPPGASWLQKTARSRQRLRATLPSG
jgi:hypothetical protein